MAKLFSDDTIAAIATPIGEGGISIIRVSGPEAFEITGSVFKSSRMKGSLKESLTHTVQLGVIVDSDGTAIDQVLVTPFFSPHSYTGEHVAEISSHGGMAVTKKVLDVLLSAGARMAEPGEFTKRAFLNGKMDLTQAEAVIDLIRAKSSRSAETAMRQLEGALSDRFRGLRARMMKIYAHMEAFLDFPEEDIEVYDDQALIAGLNQIAAELRALIDSFKRGSLIREGIACVIAGRPNVGKSSLFNTLLERDRALVSELAGTTRDMLEESIDIDGLSIRLIDTAGLGHESENPLDRIGMDRTRKAVSEAQLLLYMVDGSVPLAELDCQIFEELKGPFSRLVLINKCDRPRVIDLAKLEKLTGTNHFIFISTKTREGLEELEKSISSQALDGHLEAESVQVTRLRHKRALESALESLDRSRKAFSEKISLDLVILDLKNSLDHLGELIGEVYSEDLLDVIFSEFCIGK